MKIYRAENTNVFGTRWIIASSVKEATKIALSLNMVRDPKNLTITEMSDQEFPDTDIKEIKCSGLGALRLSMENRKEWEVYDTFNSFKVVKKVN